MLTALSFLSASLLACDPAADSSKTGASDSPADSAAPYACGEAAGAPRWCSSCAAIQRAWPDAADGLYTLQPDETAAAAPFDTFCSFTGAGGGWTLIATNAWRGAWTEESILSAEPFGDPSLTADYKSPAFSSVLFADLRFETGEEYAVYAGVGDLRSDYHTFQAAVPLHNCGVETGYEWPMTEGNLTDPDLCSTDLYIHPIDWEGGLLPCADSEIATGPAWSGQNKQLGCPLNDPYGTSFIVDPWDLNPWGDHNPAAVNVPLRMWVR